MSTRLCVVHHLALASGWHIRVHCTGKECISSMRAASGQQPSSSRFWMGKSCRMKESGVSHELLHILKKLSHLQNAMQCLLQWTKLVLFGATGAEEWAKGMWYDGHWGWWTHCSVLRSSSDHHPQRLQEHHHHHHHHVAGVGANWDKSPPHHLQTATLPSSFPLGWLWLGKMPYKVVFLWMSNMILQHWRPKKATWEGGWSKCMARYHWRQLNQLPRRNYDVNFPSSTEPDIKWT